MIKPGKSYQHYLRALERAAVLVVLLTGLVLAAFVLVDVLLADEAPAPQPAAVETSVSALAFDSTATIT